MIEEMKKRIEDLEEELRLNAKLLSRQCDLAREAETERGRLSRLLIESRIIILKLEEAMEQNLLVIENFIEWSKGPEGDKYIKDIPDDIWNSLNRVREEK